MYKKVDVIVAAAGSGRRMKVQKNKLFLEIDGTSIVERTIATLCSCNFVRRIILVVQDAEKNEFIRCLSNLETGGAEIFYIEGGTERFESVKNGLLFLRQLKPQTQLVFVHDAARPLLSHSLMIALRQSANQFGASIPVLPVTDTLRQKKEGESKVVNRQEYFLTQTPQAFLSKYIDLCFLLEKAKRLKLTDDASYIEYRGFAVRHIPGEKSNIKITHSEDLELAQAILKLRSEISTN